MPSVGSGEMRTWGGGEDAERAGEEKRGERLIKQLET